MNSMLGGDVRQRPIRWIIAGKRIKRFGQNMCEAKIEFSQVVFENRVLTCFQRLILTCSQILVRTYAKTRPHNPLTQPWLTDSRLNCSMGKMRKANKGRYGQALNGRNPGPELTPHVNGPRYLPSIVSSYWGI